MVAVTIAIFSSVLFVMDAAGPYMAESALQNGGKQDVFFYPRNDTYFEREYFQDANLAPLVDWESIQQKIPTDMPEIDFYFPRLRMYANGSTETTGTVIIVADLAREYVKNFGLVRVEPGSTVNLSKGLGSHECLLAKQLAEAKNLVLGDTICLDMMHGGKTNYTIAGLYDPEDKYPYGDWRLSKIVLDLPVFWKDHPQFNGKINIVTFAFKNQGDYYQLQDWEGTQERVFRTGGKILCSLGVSEWTSKFANLDFFETANQVFLVLVILFTFMLMLTLIFCVVLIHSSISTAVSEQVREYGILRAVGAKRRHIFGQVVLEGFITGAIGVTIGIVGGFVLTNAALLPGANLVVEGISSNTLKFTFRFQTLLIIAGVGLGASLLVTLIPSIRTYRMSIVQEMYPDRFIESEMFSRKGKDRSSRLRPVILGAVMWAVGMTIMLLLPTLIFFEDIQGILYITIALAFLQIMALILIALGVIPAFYHAMVRGFGRIFLKFREILQIGIFRHQRRNRITSILIILSFSLLVFLNSIVKVIGTQAVVQEQLVWGSDLRIEVRYTYWTPLTTQQRDDLMEIDGVERASGMVKNLDDLSQIYRTLWNQSNLDLSLRVMDLGGIRSISPMTYAIDENYYETVFNKQIFMVEGNKETAFKEIFDPTAFNIVISDRLADLYGLHLSDFLRLEFQRDETAQKVDARVVGIYKVAPGAYPDLDLLETESEIAVLFSQEHLVEYLGLNQGTFSYLTRIFVKLRAGTSLDDVLYAFESLYGYTLKEKYLVSSYQDEAEDMQNYGILGTAIAFPLMLMIVLMALQGLVVSGYTIFLERQFEITMFRALGLSKKDIRQLLFAELFIILVANGILGTIVGYVAAVNFSTLAEFMFNIQTEKMPPWEIIGPLFLICVGILYVQFRRMFRAHIADLLISPSRFGR